MIVVDASAMVMALVSATVRGDAARAVLTATDLWVAPGHMPLEVVRTLRKAVVAGQLAEPDAAAAFTALTEAAITYVPTTVPLLRAAWRLRHNVSAYDATYLAVAIEYDAPLVTFDDRLAKAAAQVEPSVTVHLP